MPINGLSRPAARLLDEYARRPLAAGGERWSVNVGMHPDV
jgi:hypothetical protein